MSYVLFTIIICQKEGIWHLRQFSFSALKLAKSVCIKKPSQNEKKKKKEKLPQSDRLYSDLVKISLSMSWFCKDVCLAGHLVLQEIS